MRELVTKEYTTPLAYAAAVLFLAQFAVATLLHEALAAFAVHLLFVPVLVLLVVRVAAPPWARLAGYGWAALALVADLVAITSGAFGADLDAARIVSALSLLPGAAWLLGASELDDGAGRALGAAAAAGVAFSGLLGLTRNALLVADWPLGALIQQLALVLAIVWFAVLGKDLSAGKRHWGGPHRVLG